MTTKTHNRKQRQGLTQSALARLLGFSQQRVSYLVKNGQITPECIFKDGTIDAARAIEVLKDTLRPSANGSQKATAKTSKVGSYYAARAEHELIKIELARLDLDERRGLLVPKDLVIKIMVQAATSCKQKLLAIPTAAAQDLLGAGSIEEVREILRRKISEALEDLSVMAKTGTFKDIAQEDQATVPKTKAKTSVKKSTARR